MSHNDSFFFPLYLPVKKRVEKTQDFHFDIGQFGMQIKSVTIGDIFFKNISLIILVIRLTK